jgi:hypothetical protein
MGKVSENPVFYNFKRRSFREKNGVEFIRRGNIRFPQMGSRFFTTEGHPRGSEGELPGSGI